MRIINNLTRGCNSNVTSIIIKKVGNNYYYFIKNITNVWVALLKRIKTFADKLFILQTSLLFSHSRCPFLRLHNTPDKDVTLNLLWTEKTNRVGWCRAELPGSSNVADTCDNKLLRYNRINTCIWDQITTERKSTIVEPVKYVNITK